MNWVYWAEDNELDYMVIGLLLMGWHEESCRYIEVEKSGMEV